MRTTVDLPSAVHRRAQEIAHERHRSLSAVVADLAVRGLATLGETLGRRITSQEVAAALDDE
jgi:hypothetical protein